MSKKLIIGNWKMNPNSLQEAKNLFNSIKEGIKNVKSEVVICPPFVYLPAIAEGNSGLALGAQNIFWEEKGAFTGEISAEMLKDLGVEYVIIGHSERRKLGETDELINKKIKEALDDNLKVIFCIGETQDDRNKGKKSEILEKQIKIGLNEVKITENLIIAYEPVWAIGTGNNCGVEETKESIEFIKKIVPNIKTLYGGSVKSENSGDYIKKTEADGLLVGGASLDSEEFIKIVKSVE